MVEEAKAQNPCYSRGNQQVWNEPSAKFSINNSDFAVLSTTKGRKIGSFNVLPELFES